MYLEDEHSTESEIRRRDIDIDIATRRGEATEELVRRRNDIYDRWVKDLREQIEKERDAQRERELKEMLERAGHYGRR